MLDWWFGYGELMDVVTFVCAACEECGCVDFVGVILSMLLLYRWSSVSVFLALVLSSFLPSFHMFLLLLLHLPYVLLSNVLIILS